MSGSHEDDDRGMFGPHLDEDGTADWTPEYTDKWLSEMSNTAEILQLCRKKQEQEDRMEQETNGTAEEIASPRMSREMKEIFMLANRAMDLMTDLFDGLGDKDRETLRKMVSQGTGTVETRGESFMAVYGKVRSLLAHIRRETSGGRLVQTFEIWKEGFEDEDGREQAELLVKGVPGSDFHDAVRFWYESTLDAEHIYGPLSVKGSGKSAKMWLWGCRLYDNEQDARKRFG